MFNNVIASSACFRSFSDSFLKFIKSNFGNESNACFTPNDNPVKNSLTPSTNPESNPTKLLTRLANLPNPSSIFGNVFTNHPINMTPKKSNILPKNPFVLLCNIFPSFLVTPLTVDDSNSSSLFFLLIFSLLFLKYSLSFAVDLDVAKFLFLVVSMIPLARTLVLVNPLENSEAESLIELILIDDLNNEFLLSLSAIIPCSH